MNKDWFDKALKNKLPDSATDFDLEAAWTALESRRRKKPRRRVLAWWLLAGFILLAGGGTAWWWSAQPELTISGNRIFSNDHHAAGDQYSVGDHHGAGDQHPAGDRTGRPYAASRVGETQSSTDNFSSIKNNLTTTQNPAKPVTDNPRSSVEATLAVAQHGASGVGETQSSAGNISSIKNDPTTTQNPSVPAANNPRSSVEATRGAGTIENVECLPTISGVNIQSGRPEFPFKPVAQMPAAERHKRRKASKWSVGAQAVFGTNQVSRSGAPDYVTARNQEEKTLDMFQVGLDIRRQLNRHFFIQTGIQFAQWTDVRRTLQTTESTRPDPNLLLERIIYPDGSIENIFGPGEVRVLSTTRETRYNRYRHIEAPILMGLTLPFGKRWQLDAAAGVAIGLVARPSGSTTIGSETFALDALPYRNAGTLSATGSLAWLYRRRDWSAGLALTGRTGLNSSSRDAALFSEKRRSVGLGLVVRRVMR